MAQMCLPLGFAWIWPIVALCFLMTVPMRATAQETKPRPAVAVDAISGIIDAFRTHRVVSFPGGHTDGNEGQALLRALVRDPRFASVVNDIVVEFGSSRYQDLMDRYIRGEEVPETAVQRAWLDAVNGGTALDNPNTASFFRAVREVNATVPSERRMRVLLGDPPMDWENVRGKADFRKWAVQRDSYPADLVRRLVLARNRRALIVYANGHLKRQEILTNYDMTDWQAQTIVSLIEATGGVSVFTVRAQGTSLSRWQADTASWRPMSLATVRGTVLGAVDFSEFDEVSQRYQIRGEDDFVPLPRDKWVSRRAEDIVDAVLYVGPESASTRAGISPLLCADPSYVKMRIERIGLIGLPPGEADKVKRECQVSR